ncbi:hypothetical protein KC335_g7740 [Hortaea werneckii]|nr:hypothetical protein KC358_g12257 [Hortaea werneckii]KAI6927581.1 hypothetical protein KC341_g12033 [Hortaea werneckii]KAI7023315.1 hypothetical protein KC366_g12749 [Hortaea werneckii]KAI7024316.1 hypothetical protein KC362_g12386 [Hortaea werneckii]KAI7122382.1 hypothetical protein KC337_g12611 [Hortaea werneckii]
MLLVASGGILRAHRSLAAAGSRANVAMAIGGAAANKTLPLSETYGDAGQMIQMACGPSYAVDAVQRTNAAAASMGLPPVGFGVTVLLAVVVSLICW